MVAIVEEGKGLDFETVLASSVHDMKNSLNMLLCTLDEVTENCKPEVCSSASKFTQLQYEGQRLNNDLIQLLAIYRIGNAQYVPNICEHAVEDFLEESALQYETLLSPKGINIELDCEPGVTGFFDREMVAGVVNNVVNNAYRYSKDRICLSATEEAGYLVISVGDNGKGYPDSMLCEHSDQLTSVNFATGSTGLGLYFSSLVAKMHKTKVKEGYVSFSNTGIDGGGRFSIYLP